MQSFSRSFTVLPSVDSTNNYAMQRVHARLAKHGDAWFAMNQTKGKGQRGKTWYSREGENIILSVVLTPSFLAPTQSFLLNATVALAAFDFFRIHAGDDTRIKWPNDVYWRDRKAGGILIENSIQSGNWRYAVAGFGININQNSFEDSLSRPVSLKQITGKHYDVVNLAGELVRLLEEKYNTLLGGNEALILQSYQQSLYKLGDWVRFRSRDKETTAMVKGVSADGLLIVQSETGEEEKWAWGSVEWLF